MTLPSLAQADPVWSIFIPVTYIPIFIMVARNYRRNDAKARNRIKIIVSAFVCYWLFVQIGAAASLNGGWSGPLVWIWAVSFILTFLAPALLAYAVLRQRLFDLEFALSRTLVYGIVSSTLLASFGLAEWAIDRLIPEAWHKESALYSAGIALLLFLSFHRLRDLVEKQVERLFFHRWHHAEVALKRFVAAAGHFDQSSALCRSFATELAKFAQGASTALYLRDPGGVYRHCSGSLDRARFEYTDDDQAFALMRAERRPLEIDDSNTMLPGALALPILDQGTVAGFVLVASKPDNSQYRPDEVELLGWATHQVGLDLQALDARELRAEVASLRAEAAMLREKLATRGDRKVKLTGVREAPQQA